MPELPEVETIKKQLKKTMPLKIRKAHLSPYVNSISNSPQKLSALKGLNIISLERKGKLLIIHLEKDKYLLSRLGMSGTWRIGHEKIDEKHTHVQLECLSQDVDSTAVFWGYIDPRRFGSLNVVDRAGYENALDRLGVDVSSSRFTVKYLENILDRYPQWPIKALLLEQKLFAGIGNYIACEICARSRILPDRKSGDMNAIELKKIISSAKAVIKLALKAQGTSFSTFTDANGNKGRAANHLVVYRQKVCGLCGEEVKKINLKGRGTFYCPVCQS